MAEYQKYSVALLDQTITAAGGYICHLLAPAAATKVTVRLKYIEVDAADRCQFRVGYASAVANNGTAALPASNPEQSTRGSIAKVYKDTAVISLTENAADSDLRAVRPAADVPIPWEFEDDHIVMKPGGSIYIYAKSDANTTGSFCIEWIEESRP